MESSVDRAEQRAGTQLHKMRWTLGLNGLLSIAVAVVILLWPGVGLYALTILFGAYAFANGIVGLVYSFPAGAYGERGWLIVSSLLGIAIGVTVLLWTGISALALLYLIGMYATALGIIAIGGAFWLPIDGGDTTLMNLSGVVSIVFGIVIFARCAGALVTLALVAAFPLVAGVTQLTVAIGGKRLLDGGRNVFERKPSLQPSH